MAPGRKNALAIMCAALGATAVVASLAAALAVSFSPAKEKERAPEPDRPTAESDAVRAARRALAEGDAAAAAKAIAGATEDAEDLRATIGRLLAGEAEAYATGHNLKEARRLLDLAKAAGSPEEELTAAMKDLEARLAKRKEAEKLLAEAEAARKRGDSKAAAEAARKAMALSAGPGITGKAKSLLKEVEAEQKRLADRETALATAEKLLAEGDVGGARRTLEQYARGSGDLSLADRIADLRRVEDAGGTGTYAPVRTALRFLTAHLGPDGGLRGETYMKVCGDVACAGDPAVRGHDVGLTGLALLAFSAFRAIDLREEFTEPAAKAAKFLAQSVGRDGRTGGSHYSTAIAALSLLEHGGAEDLKAAAKIVAYLEKDAVLVDGGWRYAPKEWRSDTSVTCWVLQAFDAAKARDVPVNDGVLFRGLDFLARARRPDGHATYTEYEGGGPQLTAASLLARLLFATEAPDVVNDGLFASLALSLKPLTDLAADPRRRKDAAAALWAKWRNEYGWYYVTYALAKRPGEAWDRWRPTVESALTTHQVAEGHLAGTWAPGDFQWAKTCGRCYVTAMNALTLAAVYRHEGAPR